MAQVKDKAENYALYNAGRFGTKLRTWPSLEEALADPWDGPVAIRYSRPGSPFCIIGISKADLPRWVRTFEKQGASRQLMQFSEGIIGERPFQGEVRRSPNYYDLTYTTEEGAMRDAMRKRQQYASGLKALCLLRHHLPPSDFEWMEELFEEWPDAVIEFSCFAVPVGTLNRNTIFWEVRDY